MFEVGMKIINIPTIKEIFYKKDSGKKNKEKRERRKKRKLDESKEFKHKCFRGDRDFPARPINFEGRDCNSCQCSVCTEKNMSINPLNSCSECRDNMGSCLFDRYLKFNNSNSKR